jgi:hypothetical protein
MATAWPGTAGPQPTSAVVCEAPGAFGPALAQGLGIEGRDRGARAATAAGDEQGGFGQAVQA